MKLKLKAMKKMLSKGIVRVGAITLALTILKAGAHVHAENDELGWDHEGTPTYEPITKEEIDAYEKDKEEGKENPGEHDAEAVVIYDAEQEGLDPAPVDNTYVDYSGDPADFHPEEGLLDEIDRKTIEQMGEEAASDSIVRVVAFSTCGVLAGYLVTRRRKDGSLWRRFFSKEEINTKGKGR